MPATQLTDDQRELLGALMDRHAETSHPVKRATIAAAIDCHPVTISTRMQQLRALGLVESTTGPKGGYEPTLQAYDVLAGRTTDPSSDVRVTRNDEPVAGVRVRGLTLTEVHHPRRCRGELPIDGPIAGFAGGDAIAVGPTPGSGLHVEGVVVETDPDAGVVVLDIEALSAPGEGASEPTERVSERDAESASRREPEPDAEPDSLSG